MTSHIYIEEEVANHPRVEEICARFPKAEKIICERYGEVFNKRAQNFRTQKQSSALILAKKYGNLVLPAPKGYGLGGQHNYYFSHMMNCVYDCRYCFLQGMYRSAHYVVFVNYEDFIADIRTVSLNHPAQDVYFFSGYDCDSLAYEPVTGFIDYMLPAFANQTQRYLELRTKSTQVRGLLKRTPIENCIVAFSLSPEDVIGKLEHKTPDLQKRLEAMLKLQQAGWPIGLRFDPVLYRQDYQARYGELFDRVFSVIDADKVHSVSVGMFRLPESYYTNITNLYPDERLFANAFQLQAGMISYGNDIETEVIGFCVDQLSRYLPVSKLYPCHYVE